MLIKQLTERIGIGTLRFLYGLQAVLALPLGELSPQVTERALQPFSNDTINLYTYSRKISVNIPVGESQNLQTKRRQELNRSAS